MKSQELREQRAKLVSDMRGILNKAEAEKRELSADENTNYLNIEADVEKLETSIERAENLEKREADLASVIGKESRSGGYQTSSSQDPKQNDKSKAFRAFLRSGFNQISAQYRDLLAGTDSAGGFLVPDEQFVKELLTKLADSVYIRAAARKYTISGAQTGGIPTLESGFADCEWTSEVSTGAADDLTFGKRTLKPTLLSKEVKISMMLLQNAFEDPASLVASELAKVFGTTEEKAFILGTGASQPLGMMVASTNGISTDRDVSTDNTSSAVTFEGLINCQEHVKDQYKEGAVWLGSRDLRKQVRKIKGSDGQFIWEQSTKVGVPSTLLGHNFIASEFMPKTFSTGQYVGLFGNLNFYGIADRMDMGVQRLDELYAKSNKVGFIGRKETDGMPLLEEAFARVKLG
jgi:HK97 family phage major capsid protein